MDKQEKIRAGAEIAIDARWLRSGIGTYTYNLIAGFPRHANGYRLRAIANSGTSERLAPFCTTVRISDAPIYTFREQIEVPAAARGAALLHVPHYNVPLLYRGKLVVSILDLIHITDPEYRKQLVKQAYPRIMLNIAARKSDHIVTISEFSKREIIEHLGVPASKISVIYCGVGPQFRPIDPQVARAKVSAALSIDRPYVLYVGNLKPHKNLRRFFQAFSVLRARNKFEPHVLVVTGESQVRRKLDILSAELNIAEALLFRDQVSDDLLPWVYAGAECLVMPSRLEGFGLPVLEALACGTPVVCSNAASLPEVGGNAVEYFDPNDVEDMASAIYRVVTSNDTREHLRTKSAVQVAQFSWDTSVRAHCEVYRQVLEE